jgi:hypothetical protein
MIIAEELQTHSCKKIENYKIEDNIMWVFDGEKWTPCKLSPPKSKHPNFTPDDSAEPNFTLCYVTFYRKPSIMI